MPISFHVGELVINWEFRSNVVVNICDFDIGHKRFFYAAQCFCNLSMFHSATIPVAQLCIINFYNDLSIVNLQGCGSKHLLSNLIYQPKESGGNVKTMMKCECKIYTLGLEGSRKEISAIPEKNYLLNTGKPSRKTRKVLQYGGGKLVVLFEK